MLVSIVIPAYNAERTLDKCLEACLAQTHHATEVIVVDDGSTDRTAPIAKELPVRYIHQQNQGPAAARNRGTQASEGEVVAFTDADCVPKPDWIEKLLGGFNGDVTGVGGTYGMADGATPMSRMIHEEIRVRHSRFGPDIDFLGSFNVAYRKEALIAAGGFDEDFRHASGEDNDLAYRLHTQGGRLCFTPHAVVDHFHPTELVPYLRKQRRHGFWRMKLYAKHPLRAGGDRYAGLGDLLAPPLALLVPFLILGSAAAYLANTFFAVAAALTIGLLSLYVLIHVPMPLRMAMGSRDVVMLRFAYVAILRDYARAAGMVHGFWHFVIRRKKTC